jgi:hypothetical protein
MPDDSEINIIGQDTSFSTNWIALLTSEIMLYKLWIEILDCLEEFGGHPSP